MKSAGISAGELADAALRRVEAHLHRVEVEHAVARDHDLAVERGVGRQQLAQRAELGEVAQQRPLLARPERELAAVVLEHAAEAVPLRLVLPAVAGRELRDELGLHRREGDVWAWHRSRKAMRVTVLDGAPARWETAMTLEFAAPLVKHIDEAIAMEGSVLRLLDSAILAIDDADAKEALRHHKADTERHIDRLRQRLLAHGGTPSLVREAGGMRRRADEEPARPGAQRARGARARATSTRPSTWRSPPYRLLERIAIWAGDEETAEVARANRADEERMVAWIDDHWNCLAEVALAERLTHA